MEKLTNSRIQTRQRCPQREVYHYVDRLRPRVINWALSIGSAFHVGMESLNRGEGEEEAVRSGLSTLDWIESLDPDVDYKLHLETARLEVMIRQAARRFAPVSILAIEREFDLPITNPVSGRKSRSFRLGGKIDAIAEIDGGLWLIEFKTTGATLDQYRDGFGLSNQITLYQHAAAKVFGRPIEGTIMRVVTKTRTEPKRKGGEVVESWADYTARLMEIYDAEPERYIGEDRVYRSAEDLQRFERELWAETQERNWQIRAGIVRRNTAACADFAGCAFKAICLGVPEWESMYRVSSTAHDELPSESESA